MASKIDNRAVAFFPQSREVRSTFPAGTPSVGRSRLPQATRDEFVSARPSRWTLGEARGGRGLALARNLGFEAAAIPARKDGPIDPALPDRPHGVGDDVHYEWWVSEALGRGDQPKTEEFAKLKSMGFKSIVNLRGESNEDEAACRANGLNYLHVDWKDGTAPTQAQMVDILKFMTDPANGPAFVHCFAGRNRTSVAVACYEMAVLGMNADQAISEGRTFGLHTPSQLDFIKQFGADLAAGKIPGFPLTPTDPGTDDVSGAAQPNATIPDGQPVTSTLHFDQDVSVKSLKLDLDILHKYRGDLKVTLTSPSGKSVVVSNHEGGSAHDIQGTFDLSEAFKGESTKGDWVLSVQDDHAGGAAGTFQSWGLHISKDQVDPGPVTKPADISEVEQRYGWAAGGWQDRLLKAADQASGAADGKTTAAELDAYLANPTDLQFLSGSAMYKEESDIASKGGSVAVGQLAAGYEQALAAKADQAGNGDGKVTSAEMKTYLTSVKRNTDEKPKTADMLWLPDQLQAQLDARIQDVTGEANPLMPQGKPNDTILLNQDYMRMAWNKTTRTPDWVSYQLSGADIRETPSWVQRLPKAPDPFHKDPQLGGDSPDKGDYQSFDEQHNRVHFDRGHQKPAHDSPSMDAMRESFLYSNMAAQTAELNQHSWELLERCTNELVGATGGKARVITGSAYIDANGKPLSPEQMKWTGQGVGKGVAIPTHSFKIVLLDRPDGTKTAYAYLVPNRNDIPVGTQTDRSAEAKFLQGCRVSIDQLEKITGYDFFADLPADVQQSLESDSTSRIALPDSLRTKEAALLWPQA